MGKLLFQLTLLLVVVVCITLYVNNKQRGPFIAHLTDNAAAYNNEEIAELIDWNELRLWMVRDLHDRFDNPDPQDPNDTFRTYLNLEQIVDVVDYYIQPQNIVLLFKIKKGYAPQYYEKDFVNKDQQHRLTGFKVTFRHPEYHMMTPPYRFMKVEAVFGLDLLDLSWKMTELHVPLSLVPTTVPETARNNQSFEGPSAQEQLPLLDKVR